MLRTSLSGGSWLLLYIPKPDMMANHMYILILLLLLLFMIPLFELLSLHLFWNSRALRESTNKVLKSVNNAVNWTWVRKAFALSWTGEAMVRTIPVWRGPQLMAAEQQAASSSAPSGGAQIASLQTHKQSLLARLSHCGRLRHSTTLLLPGVQVWDVHIIPHGSWIGPATLACLNLCVSWALFAKFVSSLFWNIDWAFVLKQDVMCTRQTWAQQG